jgi:hypothetical protein
MNTNPSQIAAIAQLRRELAEDMRKHQEKQDAGTERVMCAVVLPYPLDLAIDETCAMLDEGKGEPN